jgi:hypothetical protein
MHVATSVLVPAVLAFASIVLVGCIAILYSGALDQKEQVEMPTPKFDPLQPERDPSLID